MSDETQNESVELAEHEQQPSASDDGIVEEKKPADLQAVFDAPVKVTVILGRTKMKVNELVNMGKGTILELDRKVGESVDIFVNNRLIARGEVVLDGSELGVTMTEIISTE